VGIRVTEPTAKHKAPNAEPPHLSRLVGGIHEAPKTEGVEARVSASSFGQHSKIPNGDEESDYLSTDRSNIVDFKEGKGSVAVREGKY